ncbi:MAG TPA: murein biosynthesis integral membrane protein MurJ [Candidatus Nanoarchaeia archaeon]|nr:murein biosynthesis integral membrane protein MurJ [Candidatus Nanoarchaeia archaeon]
MIKRLFNKEINSITVAAILVALSSLVSRLLGVLRDHILAGQFGAGATLDAYYAAFRVPDLIFNLLVLGALSAGLIPVFTCLVKDFKGTLTNLFGLENTEAWRLINNILNLILISLGVLSALGIIFADPIIRTVIAPGFSPAMQARTAELSRIMFLSPIILAISSIFSGVLQTFKRFFVYSLAPIMYNIGIIGGALFLVPIWGINGLAWGVVFGALLHMLIQLPAVFALGYKYRPFLNLRDVHLRKILMMMVPRTLSLAVSQLNLVVITVIASGLASGSLTVFNLANNLQYFPIGIFGVSFAIAAFPSLAAATFDNKKLVRNFSWTIRQILFFIVPSTILLLVLRAQIVRVVLGSGNFTWQDTMLTFTTLGFFSVSLFAQATAPLLIRVFYVKEDSTTPFVIGIISVVAERIIALYLVNRMGVGGLALAFSLANILNFILLWLMLHLRLGDLNEGKILLSVLKFSLAGLVCGFVAQEMKGIIWPAIDMTRFLGVLVQGAAAGICGLLVYAIVCALLRSEEMASFISSAKSRLLRIMAKNPPAAIQSIDSIEDVDKNSL